MAQDRRQTNNDSLLIVHFCKMLPFQIQIGYWRIRGYLMGIPAVSPHSLPPSRFETAHVFVIGWQQGQFSCIAVMRGGAV